MADVSVNVRHRVGLLGKTTIAAAELLSRIGLTLPVSVLVWSLNRSSYVSVNGGAWQRCPLGLDAKDFQ